MAEGAYARAGVSQPQAGRAVAALVEVLGGIDPGRPARAVLGPGHYASVLRVGERTGVALAADGVGTKLVVAERLGRFESVGIDCVAMNVNDVVCLGAEPIALLDYVAVEEPDPELLERLAVGLKRGAEEAGVEIPGGELAVVPELIRGHPSPRGIDLVGFCVGVLDIEAMVTGRQLRPGDAIIGLPSTGIHSNGLTLARRALRDLDESPPELDGRTVGEELLRPTAIYVRAVLDLLSAGLEIRGLAHITGEGLLNLLRLEAEVGYRIDAPLPSQPIFGLIAARAGVKPGELYETFNMGCGFCCLLPSSQAEAAVELLAQRHPGSAVIGEVTDRAGVVDLPVPGLLGRHGAGFTPA